jgi:hypothetical protein
VTGRLASLLRARVCAVSCPVSTLIVVLTNELQNVLAEVHVFVGSNAGRDAIRNALARRRLPGYLDVEIEEAVLGEALRFLKGGGVIVSPAGWCRARITARAVDLTRGALRDQRRWGVRVTFNDDAIDAIADGHEETDGNESLNALTGDLDQVRRDLLRSGENSTAIAGALTFVSLIGDEAEPLKDCPQPSTGADTEESAIWAVLWYLGMRDCFIPGNAAAKRRSRAARNVRELLRTWGGRV